ncbi:MAG: VWA domain-containing protein [Schlesneria sp.]
MTPANAPKESVAAGREILARQSSLGNSAVRSLPDWIPHVLFLSSLLSLLAHLVLLVVFSFYLAIRYPGAVGFTTEPMREVGIVIKDKGDNPNAVVPGEPRAGDATESTADGSAVNEAFVPSRATSDQPPVETMLPREESSTQIGPGVNLPIGATVMDPRQPVKSGGGQRQPASGTVGGPTGTAFMGTRDQGSKVVFVIDASGSMMSHNSMQVAKASLVSSVQELDGNQQFLIIFYDDKPVVLHLRDVHQPQLYAATEIHKTLAKQTIAGIHPGTGTQHYPALEMAMRLKPDVIFFLTDGQEPPLDERELELLKKLNGQKTRIHSIEFGVGAEVSEGANPRNFLRKLSYQNGGTYRYYDVTKFK